MSPVLGLDLSLTGCGVAGEGWADTITFPPRKRSEDRTDYSHRRLAHIKTSLQDFLTGVQFVAMEGLSYDSYDTNRQSAGLAWIVRHDLLWTRGIPYALVPPSNLKQYVTGSGGADKTRMVAAIRGCFPWFDGDDNAADAAGLHAMACDWLGQPAVEVPAKQRKALDGCDWPELFLFTGTAEVA